ncbi:unnamed protein product [Schistosoma mattheei]|uniref:CCHC-type domain-containing protein n=1 Tax=Schistosoma mattheei TaxID=31246 RepID=A0AA85AY82_9TREM|nr:unnamed protein product [Schistosoma mattheei]
MEPAMEKLDIHSTPEAFEDYLERFEIWSMTKEDDEDVNIVAYFLTFIGREAYSLLKTLAYPEKPISLPYATLKELLLSHVKCTSFECRERAKFHKMVRQNDQKAREFILELQKQAAKCNFGDQLHVQLRDRLIAGINIPSLERELLKMPNCSFQDARTACINYEAVNELDIQSMKISNTLLSRRDELQSQGQSNLRSFNSDSYSRVNMKGVSTRNYKANHKGEMKFGKCLSCGKFHARNSCVFPNAKCFKCGEIGHIQSVCKATVHFASSCTKSCNLNFNNSDVSNDHLSLSTISKDSAESYGSSELDEIQNSCETTVPNQPIYQNSHAIVPGMTFPNDSHISNEITCNIEENMLNEPNHDRKPDVVWIDADFSNDPTLCNDSPNEFHENISEQSNPDVISYITSPHNAFDPCEKPAQCEARVLSDLEFDYISDDFISTAVYPYHKNSSNVYSKQCEKYVLNEATLFITWGYKDPTLFRGGG